MGMSKEESKRMPRKHIFLPQHMINFIDRYRAKTENSFGAVVREAILKFMDSKVEENLNE